MLLFVCSRSYGIYAYSLINIEGLRDSKIDPGDVRPEISFERQVTGSFVLASHFPFVYEDHLLYQTLYGRCHPA